MELCYSKKLIYVFLIRLVYMEFDTYLPEVIWETLFPPGGGTGADILKMCTYLLYIIIGTVVA